MDLYLFQHFDNVGPLVATTISVSSDEGQPSQNVEADGEMAAQYLAPGFSKEI